MRDIFGADMILTPDEKSKYSTMNELLSNGKHILFETQTKGWTEPNGSFVFYPALWDTPHGQQFGPDSFIEFPNCSISGIYTYNTQLSRDLGDTVTEKSGRDRQYHKIIESVTKCGI